MNRFARFAIAAGVAGGLVFVGSGLLFDRGGDVASIAAGPLGSAACAACHGEAYAEWQESWHGRAYVDPEVRALSNDYANEQCIDCHAPRPVLETGIGKPPLPRAARRAEGVDCLACHGVDNSVATLSKTAAGPCAPRFDSRLGDVQHCGTCHDQHFTIQEWQLTPFSAQGMTCAGCHMPPADRASGKRGASHRFAASHDEAELKRAVAVRVAREGGGDVVYVKNIGAGHHFPTDERSRAADLIVRWRGAGGAIVKIERLDRYRSPYRDEAGASDGLPYREESPLRERRPASTLLPYGVERAYRLQRPEGAGTAEIILTYKTIPYPAEPEAILADEASFRDKKAFILFRETLDY